MHLDGGWLAAIAKVPGLHMGLALASALASYLNLAQLWRGLRRDGVYVRQPGWGRHLAAAGGRLRGDGRGRARRGLWLWPDWSAVARARRASGGSVALVGRRRIARVAGSAGRRAAFALRDAALRADRRLRSDTAQSHCRRRGLPTAILMQLQ